MSGFDGGEFDDGTDNNSRPEANSTDMVSIASDMCEAELTTPPIGSTVGCPCSYNGIGLQVVHQDGNLMLQEAAGGGNGGGSGGGGFKRKRSEEPTDPVADSDEHFALSCVAALRRLPARKNAEMRMRIMHMLYEAEYGEEPVLR